jgi:hypothetical protein
VFTRYGRIILKLTIKKKVWIGFITFGVEAGDGLL